MNPHNMMYLPPERREPRAWPERLPRPWVVALPLGWLLGGAAWAAIFAGGLSQLPLRGEGFVSSRWLTAALLLLPPAAFASALAAVFRRRDRIAVWLARGPALVRLGLGLLSWALCLVGPPAFALLLGVGLVLFGELRMTTRAGGYAVTVEQRVGHEDLWYDHGVTLTRPDGATAGSFIVPSHEWCGELSALERGGRVYFLCDGELVDGRTPYLDPAARELFTAGALRERVSLDDLEFRAP